jgi:hypothetical protein
MEMKSGELWVESKDFSNHGLRAVDAEYLRASPMPADTASTSE